jgi:hypothetical protein
METIGYDYSSLYPEIMTFKNLYEIQMEMLRKMRMLKIETIKNKIDSN